MADTIYPVKKANTPTRPGMYMRLGTVGFGCNPTPDLVEVREGPEGLEWTSVEYGLGWSPFANMADPDSISWSDRIEQE